MSFFNRSKRAQKGGRKPSRLKRLSGIESLESREVMAANITTGLSTGVTLASTNPAITPTTVGIAPSVTRVNAYIYNKTLMVEGTDRVDKITIEQAGSVIGINGARIVNNGVAVATINSSLINKVEVRGYKGGDTITLTSLKIPCEVWGGEGDDTILGGSKNDILHGNAGADKIWGGPGNDRLFGDSGIDQLYGGDGDDWLYGGTEDDELYGGSNNDKLFGEGGFDKLSGDSGNDWLEAGSSLEPADGGTGTDWNAHQWAINGATTADVIQAWTGTCSFLSSLASASRFYDLSSNISYEGNFTYAVWLYDDNAGGWIQERVTFDGTMRIALDQLYDPISATEGEFWTIVYQRAYLQHFEGWNDSNWILTAWFDGEPSNRALKAITGMEPSYFDPKTSTATDLQFRVGNGPMVVGDAEHSYMVYDVIRDDAGNWFVVLYNPWGNDTTHTPDLVTEPETPSFTNNDGIITVRWEVFQSVFSHGYSV